MRHIIYAVCFTALLSCRNTQQYWDISKFELSDYVLEEGTQLTLIYTSRGPEADSKKEIEGIIGHPGNLLTTDYYIHIVAQPINSNDTINILTTLYNWIEESDFGQKYAFYGEDNFITKMTLSDFGHGGDSLNLNELMRKKRTKVARDPRFDHIADNNFPTVFGRIERLK